MLRTIWHQALGIFFVVAGFHFMHDSLHFEGDNFWNHIRFGLGVAFLLQGLNRHFVPQEHHVPPQEPLRPDPD